MAKKFSELVAKMPIEAQEYAEKKAQAELTRIKAEEKLEKTAHVSVRQSLLERFEHYASQTGKNTQSTIDEALEYWLATH